MVPQSAMLRWASCSIDSLELNLISQVVSVDLVRGQAVQLNAVNRFTYEGKPMQSDTG